MEILKANSIVKLENAKELKNTIAFSKNYDYGMDILDIFICDNQVITIVGLDNNKSHLFIDFVKKITSLYC